MEIGRLEHSVVTVKGLVYAVRQIRAEPFACSLCSASILKASGHRQRILSRYFCKYTWSLWKWKCSSTVINHGGSVEQYTVWARPAMGNKEQNFGKWHDLWCYFATDISWDLIRTEYERSTEAGALWWMHYLMSIPMKRTCRGMCFVTAITFKTHVAIFISKESNNTP